MIKGIHKRPIISKVLSYSSIQNLGLCSRKFLLYKNKLRTKEVKTYFIYGSILHELIQYYITVARDGVIPTFAETKHKALRYVMKDLTDKQKKGNTIDNMQAIIDSLEKNFKEIHHFLLSFIQMWNNINFTFFNSEEYMEFNDSKGYIDLVCEDNEGRPVLIEIKTAKSKDLFETMKDISATRQLKLYKKLFMKKYGVEPRTFYMIFPKSLGSVSYKKTKAGKLYAKTPPVYDTWIEEEDKKMFNFENTVTKESSILFAEVTITKEEIEDLNTFLNYNLKLVNLAEENNFPQLKGYHCMAGMMGCEYKWYCNDSSDEVLNNHYYIEKDNYKSTNELEDDAFVVTYYGDK